MAKKEKHSKKKKRFIIFGMVLLVVLGGAVYFFAACNKKPSLDKLSGSKNFMCEVTGTPEEHSGIENVGGVIYKLTQKEAYSTRSFTKVNAMAGVKQYIKGGKDYKDGIMLSSTFSWSEASGIAAGFLPADVSLQKFFGEKKAVIRMGEADAAAWRQSNFDRRNQVWNTGDPYQVLEAEDYQKVYGVWGTEFCDYILNEQTCTQISDLSRDGELYSLTITLDPNSSVEYYIRQMVTMGGLNGAPEFSSVQMTLEFTQDWTIRRVFIEEEYSTKKAGISAACSGTTEIEFSYDESDVDVSAYESYFVNYANAASTGTVEQKKSGLDYILDGLAPILKDDTVLRFGAEVGGNQFGGDMYLSLGGLDIGALAAGGNIDAAQILSKIVLRAKLGGLTVALENNSLFLNYKDFCGRIAVADLMSSFGGVAASVNSAEEQSEPLFAVSKDWDKNPSYIPAVLNAGGIRVELGFSFEGADESFRWSGITAVTQLSGSDIKLVLKPNDGGEIPALNVSDAVDLTPYISEIRDFIQGRKYSFAVDYSNAQKGVSAIGTVSVDLTQPSVLKLQGDLSAKVGALNVPARFTLIGDELWLDVHGFRFKTNVSQLGASLPNAFSGAESLPLEIQTLLDALLAVDYDALIEGLSLTEERFALRLNAELLLGLADRLIPGISDQICGILGNANGQSVSLAYDRTKKAFLLSAFGAELTVSAFADEIAAPADFVATTDVTFAVTGNIFLKNEQILPTAPNNELLISANISGEVWFNEGLRILLRIDLERYGVAAVYYADGDVRFSYGKYWMQIPRGDWQIVADKFSSLLGKAPVGGNEAVALSLFGQGGLDVQALLNAITVVVGEGSTNVSLDLSAILGGLPTLDLDLSSDGKVISAASKEISAFGVTLRDFRADVYAGNNDLTVPVFSEADKCANVFEFLLNAYTELANTPYVGLNFTYESSAMKAVVGGKLQFVQSQENAQVGLNFDFSASVTNYALDEKGAPVLNESGEKTVSGSHYVHLIIVGENLYLTYSLVSLDASNALRFTMPVSELFAAGKTVLPILAPLLGISEDVYYFNFVDKILSGAYTTIHSGIFGVMNTAEWCDLLLGIVNEYAPSSNGSSANAASSVLVSFGTKENGDAYMSISGISDGKGEMNVELLSVKESAPVSAPSDLTGFIDVGSIATLLQDVLSAYNYKSFGYHLSGDVSIQIIGIKLDLSVRAEVFVGVEKNGSVYMNIRLRTNGYYNGLIGMVCGDSLIVKGDTVSDITIRNGMVYLSREQTTYHTGGLFGSFKKLANPYVDRKAMTMQSMLVGDNMMNEIFFALNFGDGFSNYIKKQNSGTPSSNSYDAGQMLSGYSFDGNAYAIKLDLGAISGSSQLGEMSLNVARVQRADGAYDLTSLSGTLKVVSVVSVNYTLKNHTPEDFAAQYPNLSPAEFAQGVEEGTIVPFRLADAAVNANLSAVCAAFGCADSAALDALVAANGTQHYTNT